MNNECAKLMHCITLALALEASVQNSATFPKLLLKSSKKVVFLNEISSKSVVN